jgi:acyl-coenzyme A synthetase/AMP-(fatty) acid ligase
MLTYGDLQSAADRVAHGLAARGMSSGGRIVLLLPAIPEIPIAYLAAQKIGAVVIFLSPTLTQDALRSALADINACAVFTTATLLPQLQPLPTTTPHPPQVILCEGEVPGYPTFDDFNAEDGTPFPAQNIAPYTPAAIVYTAGEAEEESEETAPAQASTERPLAKVVRRYPSEPWYFDYGM